MIPLFIWILCPADIVYLIKIDILGSRIKVMKKWCLRIFIWRYKGICLLYSPHMWRWSHLLQWLHCFEYVFSTHVEVILKWMWQIACIYCILHTCGGDPCCGACQLGIAWYSPHMWRWSLYRLISLRVPKVFSTHVESVTVLERTDK